MILKPYYDLNIDQRKKVTLILKEHTIFLNHWKLDINLKRSLKIIFLDDIIIGFLNPQLCCITGYSDYWKLVPLKISKEYQNKGYGGLAVKEFYKDKKGLVYIDNDNIPSIKIHLNIGFKLQPDLCINCENGKYYVKH